MSTSGAGEDKAPVRILKDLFTFGANEIPGVHSAISGPSKATTQAQAQQQQNFKDAIAAYARQRQLQDTARLEALRHSMTAMQPTSDMLKRMGLGGLNMTPPPALPGIGGPPPTPPAGAMGAPPQPPAPMHAPTGYHYAGKNAGTFAPPAAPMAPPAAPPAMGGQDMGAPAAPPAPWGWPQGMGMG